MTKRLAIIPARGGSKRIPHKNVKDFCGKPMVAHVIGAAERSGVFDAIHVSTDDDAIADVAKQCGHPPDFARPEALADDHASMMATLKYVVEEYQQRGTVFDTVALLYATSPLMAADDLRGAQQAFEHSNQDKALLAVASFPAPIEQAFRMADNQDLLPDNAKALATRTQDLEHAYYDAGMFAFYTADYIKASREAGDFMAFKGYVVPSFRVTDIDWPDDWQRAEALYHSLNLADERA